MSQLFGNLLFRHLLIFLSIVVLMVFCFDKSRQNVRTRNALYNCVYALYAGALVKLLQIVDLFLPFGLLACQVTGLVVLAVAALAYWRWLKPQPDIPHNGVFYWLGWATIGLALMLQVGFLCLASAA